MPCASGGNLSPALLLSDSRYTFKKFNFKLGTVLPYPFRLSFPPLAIHKCITPLGNRVLKVSIAYFYATALKVNASVSPVNTPVRAELAWSIPIFLNDAKSPAKSTMFVDIFPASAVVSPIDVPISP